MAKKQLANEALIELLDKGDTMYQKGLSVDCVIFGFHEGSLKTLLIKLNYINKYALPGGFILKNERVEEAAYRVLLERTGVKNLFLMKL